MHSYDIAWEYAEVRHFMLLRGYNNVFSRKSNKSVLISYIYPNKFNASSTIE
jgi:hypothetical protein